MADFFDSEAEVSDQHVKLSSDEEEDEEGGQLYHTNFLVCVL